MTLPMIEKRRIEASILKCVFDVLVERHGREEAETVVGQAVSNSAIAQGAEFRAREPEEPNLEDFADLLPLWQMDNALEIEVLEKAPERLDFNVTRCRYSEVYKEMGLGDIGHLLSCNRDGDFCIGYNPKMELTRTQTIMKGASHCDFRYRLKTEDGQP
ncbi:L-2-amino-thiazoline-4-carboxylic acid hydrolase [Hoeflea sp.]|uniref:L-2-amino-thiazoline-4-carboxylic acid hydrolase n=1 Tax=Hoeflea sp. TaxID=1940281 RepID=UPI0019832C46|nr:L-2-amino-thiazoline-4-carboxylic acid hydrolase [Hoeflea sp.]MBC7282201.1 L-2-amino-thiazoline-4-carboxylic acid hydrolase [Hoeflea sp.]